MFKYFIFSLHNITLVIHPAFHCGYCYCFIYLQDWKSCNFLLLHGPSLSHLENGHCFHFHQVVLASLHAQPDFPCFSGTSLSHQWYVLVPQYFFLPVVGSSTPITFKIKSNTFSLLGLAHPLLSCTFSSHILLLHQLTSLTT